MLKEMKNMRFVIGVKKIKRVNSKGFKLSFLKKKGQILSHLTSTSGQLLAINLY
jgi:hypothetical protein